jgi:hypothetical protein
MTLTDKAVVLKKAQEGGDNFQIRFRQARDQICGLLTESILVEIRFNKLDERVKVLILQERVVKILQKTEAVSGCFSGVLFENAHTDEYVELRKFNLIVCMISCWEADWTKKKGLAQLYDFIPACRRSEKVVDSFALGIRIRFKGPKPR